MTQDADSATNRFSATTATQVLHRAGDTSGVDVRDAQLMRLGENALFLLPRTQVVVRIARSMDYWADATKEVHVAQWLDSIAFPAAELHPVPQPVDVSGHPVTFWRFIVGRPGDREDLGTLGRILRRLHGTARPIAFDLPDEDILGRVESRILAAPVAEADKRFLTERFRELKGAVAQLRFPLEPAPTHGDAHSENLMIRDDGQVLLIDFERFAWGQPEWDLAMTATEYITAGWWSESEYKGFADAYGFDVMTWDGFDVLRAVHELKMTTWLMQNVQESQEIAAEYANRMQTLRTGRTSGWHPF
jgi:aminoglycoside phosphotransferase (APT) family kinase protein